MRGTVNDALAMIYFLVLVGLLFFIAHLAIWLMKDRRVMREIEEIEAMEEAERYGIWAAERERA